jgi:hypothetical protein
VDKICHVVFSTFIHSFFIHQRLYSSLLGPGLFFSFVIYTQSVGLLERVISALKGRYLHTGQHKHRINAHTDIHALSGFRTRDPSVRASDVLFTPLTKFNPSYVSSIQFLITLSHVPFLMILGHSVYSLSLESVDFSKYTECEYNHSLLDLKCLSIVVSITKILSVVLFTFTTSTLNTDKAL